MISVVLVVKTTKLLVVTTLLSSCQYLEIIKTYKKHKIFYKLCV